MTNRIAVNQTKTINTADVNIRVVQNVTMVISLNLRRTSVGKTRLINYCPNMAKWAKLSK